MCKYKVPFLSKIGANTRNLGRIPKKKKHTLFCRSCENQACNKDPITIKMEQEGKTL